MQVMSWSTSREQAVDLLPPAVDETAAGFAAGEKDKTFDCDHDSTPMRVRSGFATDDNTSTSVVQGGDSFGWSEGLSVYFPPRSVPKNRLLHYKLHCRCCFMHQELRKNSFTSAVTCIAYTSKHQCR
jgi:hypothetical protein